MLKDKKSNNIRRGSFGTDLSNTINSLQSQSISTKPLFVADKVTKKYENSENNTCFTQTDEVASIDPSIVSSKESTSNVYADDEVESTRSISSHDTKQEVFQKMSDTLLQQVEESYNNMKRSQNITLSLLHELNTFQLTMQQSETESAEKCYNEIHDLVALYTEKVNSIIEKNNEKVSVISNIEDTFHYIQSLQSQCYQNNISSLQGELESKETEIYEMKQNYQQLESWVLTVFREIVNYSKIENCNFKLSLKDIQKSIKSPPKRSNLEFIYRYLIQYLYADEEHDLTENEN
ncbi:hypothetical protein CANINC_002439 [Pichia inconspicua]|uniref:Uncharacterized protein n=1 Tax=Pichia inconspicua TaxID=52247 RepID=A0A4V4NFQ6_9ASCO|nr:hypothetical protein CANINC_002439 [[Candida] inconspicua]